MLEETLKITVLKSICLKWILLNLFISTFLHFTSSQSQFSEVEYYFWILVPYIKVSISPHKITNLSQEKLLTFCSLWSAFSRHHHLGSARGWLGAPRSSSTWGLTISQQVPSWTVRFSLRQWGWWCFIKGFIYKKKNWIFRAKKYMVSLYVAASEWIETPSDKTSFSYSLMN